MDGTPVCCLSHVFVKRAGNGMRPYALCFVAVSGLNPVQTCDSYTCWDFRGFYVVILSVLVCLQSLVLFQAACLGQDS